MDEGPVDRHGQGPGAVERLQVVATATSRVEAELKRGALESEGLHAVVLADDAGGAHPQLALLHHGAIRVAVPDHEAEHARDALAELDGGVHALPDAGDHERIDPPRHGPGLVAVALVLLGILLVYRAVTQVWPGLG